MTRIERGPITVDVAARQAQVVGDAPRIEPLPVAEMTPEAIDLCVGIRASVGVETDLSRLPEYMRTMARHPEVFRCQMEMGTAIFQGRIPVRERELAVLRVGWLCRAPYEWGQHVDIARRYGMADDEIARVTQGSAAEGWAAHDAAILRGVEELLADQAVADDTWDVLAATWDEAQMIEYVMMVGQYVATAYVQNSLRIRLIKTNPGLSHR